MDGPGRGKRLKYIGRVEPAATAIGFAVETPMEFMPPGDVRDIPLWQ
jgi:hypothetical protein